MVYIEILKKQKRNLEAPVFFCSGDFYTVDLALA